ncbi:hypothetical protein BN2476_650098 [Paraburkholderia piptadeniae]|uniref:Uncharacterized protein n=1 Tax=Paraburkholderia piptadeniae TaxID=1701573 RepID=A0A1N7SNC5_9BURK|nr:hypothetical protein BN2476_650098 [Paraburkholderia piptadeniae]
MGREFKRVVGMTRKACRESDPEKLPEALRVLLEGTDLDKLNLSGTDAVVPFLSAPAGPPCDA